jgi:hypothetical protein
MLFRHRNSGTAAACLVVAVAALLGAADLEAAKPRKAPAVKIGPIRAQLRELFAAWDLNGDGVLDKEELAKAFRGDNAKPFDYIKDDNKKPAPPSLSFLPSSFLTAAPSLASSFSLAQPYSSSLALVSYFARPDPEMKAARPAKSTDYSRYPDYIFLKSLDTNGDDKINKSEWAAWAKTYAAELKTILDARNTLSYVQQKLKYATTVAAQKRAQAELVKLKREMIALEKKMAAYDKKLQQALRPPK